MCFRYRSSCNNVNKSMRIKHNQIMWNIQLLPIDSSSTVTWGDRRTAWSTLLKNFRGLNQHRHRGRGSGSLHYIAHTLRTSLQVAFALYQQQISVMNLFVACHLNKWLSRYCLIKELQVCAPSYWCLACGHLKGWSFRLSENSKRWAETLINE